MGKGVRAPLSRRTRIPFHVADRDAPHVEL
jgi:hypothetical protein